MKVLEVKNLSFKYASQSHCILKNLNFSIEKGERVGIIGDNGSGKSTISKLILNILSPATGYIKLFGNYNNWLSHYPNLSYVGDPSHNCGQLGLPEGLLIKEVLQIVKRIYNDENYNATLDKLASEIGIKEIEDRAVESLSTGERKRLMLCLALFKHNDLIIFDEPLDGLDIKIKPIARKIIENQINEGTSVLYIGHDFTEIDAFTESVYRLHEGQLVKIERPLYSMSMIIDGELNEHHKQKQGQIQSAFSEKFEQNKEFQKMSIELKSSNLEN